MLYFIIDYLRFYSDWIALALAALVAYKLYSRSSMPEIRISDWRVYYRDVHFSTQEYYGLVQETLSARQVPDLTFSREVFRQGWMFSAKREYLRVRKGPYVFDICAAPYGKGFFVSWWYGERFGWFLRALCTIPLMKWLILRLRGNTTYYQADTQAMFEKAVECAIEDARAAIEEARGTRLAPSLQGQEN